MTIEFLVVSTPIIKRKINLLLNGFCFQIGELNHSVGGICLLRQIVLKGCSVFFQLLTPKQWILDLTLNWFRGDWGGMDIQDGVSA